MVEVMQRRDWGILRWPILCLESVFAPWINLVSLYYGSLLNSSLREANIPCLEAIQGTQMWLEMWPSSLASVSSLHHFYHYKKAGNRTNCFQTMDSRQYRTVITEKKGQVSELCSPLVHLPIGNFWTSIKAAIRVVSSAYLRSLIFVPAILIPACASSSPALS